MYPLLLLLCIVTQSCDIEIPEIDNEAPKFAFKISGDRFDRTFTQDDNFDTLILNLRVDVEYSIVYSGGDPDGVKLIQWQLPSSDYIEFSDAIESPWTIRNLSFLSRMIEWQGNESAPVTGNILVEKFSTTSESIRGSFGFYVSDFGGSSGFSNSISRTLNINIGDHNTEVVAFKKKIRFKTG